MEKNDYNIALIIDADNISYKYLDTLLTELKKYGRIAYKRAYGDFTEIGKQGWTTTIKENGIVPVQEYAHVKGKNSTDITMIIDAMDILYAKYADCFCIATSDSDFTRLITRFRESNVFIIGAGESKANKAFIRNYDRFIILDQLYKVNEKETKKAKRVEKSDKKEEIKPLKTIKPEQAKPNEKTVETLDKVAKLPEKVAEMGEHTEPLEVVPVSEIYDYVRDLIDQDDGSDWMFLATVMQKLYIQYPEFNYKLYNAKNTKEFFKMSDYFELRQSTKNKANDSVMIRNRPTPTKKTGSR
ncbi:MAG: NYN domain-containing protein [Clostridia bacterium]